ncbi:hypothetical protein GCM10009827_109510 [Dactylosporangium maewongense]|uniref:Uncharacterized protein n=1 Tax=Dactylosporangium maewongense TaxID=634393 RepID=A0ABP4NZ77_9ACTN
MAQTDARAADRPDRTDNHRRTHLFMQNLMAAAIYELGLDAPRGLRVGAAFTELAAAI